MGDDAPHGYRRTRITLHGADRPPIPAQDDSIGFGRFHLVRWERATKRMVFEAVCVMPVTEDAATFMLAHLRRTGVGADTAAPSPAGASAEGATASSLGGAVSAAADPWTEGDFYYCWFDDFNGNIECDGTTCYPMTLSTGEIQDGDWWSCDDDCTITYEYGEFWVECEYYEEPQCDPDYYDCCPDGFGGWQWDYFDECPPGSTPPLEVSLSCDYTNITRLTSINCTADTNGSIIGWKFVPTDTIVGQYVQEVNSSHSGNAWGGSMVVSGKIIVIANDEGQVAADSVEITVNPRTGPAWSLAEEISGPENLERGNRGEEPIDTDTPWFWADM